jgi:AmiR/NasT family two-component response regulator
LTSRAVIDQAKGILMGQHRVGADEAFDILRTTSQRENRKLRDLAQELVDRASQG